MVVQLATLTQLVAVVVALPGTLEMVVEAETGAPVALRPLPAPAAVVVAVALELTAASITQDAVAVGWGFSAKAATVPPAQADRREHRAAAALAVRAGVGLLAALMVVVAAVRGHQVMATVKRVPVA